MKRNLRFTLFTFAILLLAACQDANAPQVGLPVTVPEKVGLSSERLERIDKVMQQYVDEGRIAGAVTLVARRGKVAHLGTYGMADIEADKPMQANTIFRIASMTKPITSVAVMMLYEEGHFLLSDPISKYIPEFKEPKVYVPSSSGKDYTTEPARREITIHHLLIHTSGLTYYWNPRLGEIYTEAGLALDNLQDEGTLAEKTKILASLPLLHHPGEAYEYGMSTDVLGYLVEVVSSMPLDEFFRERIFEPLGMKDTHFFLPEEKIHRLASLYEPNQEGGLDKLGDETFASYPYKGPQTVFLGGSGLCSTVGDYARFAQILLNGGELGGVRLLSRKSVELMTTDHVGDLNPDEGFGLGFGIIRNPGECIMRGSLGLGSYYWGGLWYTRFFIDTAEQLVGVFMAQLYPYENVDIRRKYGSLVYQAIVD